MCFSLIFSPTVTGLFTSVTVRDGDAVTLPCDSLKVDHKCHSINWLYDKSGCAMAELLFRCDQADEAKVCRTKSDRLSVTGNCSLVIKEVTVEDVGRYTCRQQGLNSEVYLSVVTSDSCSSTVAFTTSSLKCEVTDRHSKEVKLFSFNPPNLTSGEKTDENMKSSLKQLDLYLRCYHMILTQ
uniref:Ig-like domain-containing protein n=1 Tax=Anabas testudineus TaxID=64144 RepID=A0A7N6AP59_ANATE